MRLVGVNIGGNFSCEGGKCHNPGGKALNVDGGNINGGLFWRKTTCKGDVNLGSAKAEVLVDDSDSWKSCNVILDGFTYNRFSNPMDAQSRIDWLAKRPDGMGFSPLPYEQVGKVLFGMGHTRDAREILLKKERLQTVDERTPPFRKFWRELWDVFAGYGYLWRYTAAWMLGFVVLGGIFFGVAAHRDQIVPNQPAIMASAKYQAILLLKEHTPMEAARAAFPAEYPEFTPLAFSLDVFIPLFALHQEPFWAPASNKDDDWWKSSILLVFFLAELVVFAWLAWGLQHWIRREQGGVLGPTGVGFGMAFFISLLGFNFVAGVTFVSWILKLGYGWWIGDG